MNTCVSVLLALVVWVSAAAAWSQDVPPPPTVLPMRPVTPTSSSPPASASGDSVAPAEPSQPTQIPYYPPPGAVLVAPGQPYAYAYPPPGPHAGPVLVSPPVAVLVPAPPMESYRWSVAVDALFLERSSGGSVPLGYTFYNTASHRPPALARGELYSDDVFFPLEAGLRLEANWKYNSNVTFSGTYWGLQQWSVDDAIYGDPQQQTVLASSPYLQLSTLLNGFDDALSYTYGSEIENVEFNSLFRLNSDDAYWSLDWLWGVRYVYCADHFTLTGVDNLYNATERLDYRTANNLVGVQTGLLFVHGWERFQSEVGLKFGLMANIYHQHGVNTASDLSGIPPGFTPCDIANNGSDLSALFEVSLGVRCRLSDHLWLRLAYQFYGITGLALAPRQLGGFSHGNGVAFDGVSIGLQGIW